jgi:hypothetical protein
MSGWYVGLEHRSRVFGFGGPVFGASWSGDRVVDAVVADDAVVARGCRGPKESPTRAHVEASFSSRLGRLTVFGRLRGDLQKLPRRGFGKSANVLFGLLQTPIGLSSRGSQGRSFEKS